MSQTRILVDQDESREQAIIETLDKHHYTKQLQVAAEVSQQISAILEPERLLSVTVSLLQERFELNDVHLYLFDQVLRLLVMQSDSGHIGWQPREGKHTIPFDHEQSIVAQAARSKQAVLINETCPQMALPLMVGGQLVAVLHLQKKLPNRFMQADLDVFNMLANHLATALAYTRLVETGQQAEQALRQSELKFRSLVQSAKDAIILANAAGNIIGWNAGAQAIFGYQEEELLGHPLQLIMPARYRAAHEHGFKRLQATGVSHLIGQTVEIDGLRKDGTEFPIELGLTTWSSEAATFYSGIIRDITERRQAEEERRRFTNQLRTAADLAQQINAILDLDDLLAETVRELHLRFVIDHVHIYLLDESKQELVMHTGSGEVGQLLRQRDHSIPFSRQNSFVARAARKQELVLVNEVRDAPSFMPNPLLPHTRSEVAVPLIVGGRVLGVLHMQDKQPQRFTPSDLDVLRTLAGQVATAIQNARLFEQVQQNLDETQRTAERLRELDRLKSEFLASMSHELRTPLNSIIGYAEIILMGLNGPLSGEMTEDMEAIRHSGQHLLHLINDILDLAKIEAGHMTLGYEEVELIGLLDQVDVRHRSLLHDKPVKLFIEMDQNVPPIEADRVRLNQILTNLVTNAIKFTEKGIVRLHATYNDEWVQIAVQDEGIGIKKSDIATIFEQFRQVDGSDTRRAGGTGLGLAITNHLVQLHGGTITVESEFGKGSTFLVRLPVKRPLEEPSAIEE